MSKLFFTVTEAAEALDCTTKDLKDYVRQGLLREFRDGDNINYKRDEIEALAKTKSSLKVEGDHPVRPPHAPLKMPSQQWLADAAALEDSCESVAAGGPPLDSPFIHPLLQKTTEMVQILQTLSGEITSKKAEIENAMQLDDKVEAMLLRCVRVMIMTGIFAAICTISLIVSLVTK